MGSLFGVSESIHGRDHNKLEPPLWYNTKLYDGKSLWVEYMYSNLMHDRRSIWSLLIAVRSLVLQDDSVMSMST